MKKTISAFLLIFTIFQNSYSQGQEMVYNGRFETLINLPVTGGSQIDKADGWSNISNCYPIPTSGFVGTPDLLHRYNTNSDYGVPSSAFTVPSSPLNDFYGGDSYAHISRTLGYVSWNPFTEVMQGTLNGYLQAGCYDFSMLVAKDYFYHLYPNSPFNNIFNVYLTNGTCNNKLLIYTSGNIQNTTTWSPQFQSFSLSAAQGGIYNRIRIEMAPITEGAGNGGEVVQGILLDAVSIVYYPLNLSLTGNTNFCDGNPLTFNGSVTAGTPTGYYWEIAESNSSGVPTTGGYVWSSHYVGSPSGAFTFPTLPLVCGKFYKIKLAAYNGCIPWAEATNKVIKINCLPTVNLGNDVTICSEDNFPVYLSSPTTIGSPYKYRWSYNGSPVYTGPIGSFGTTANVNVVGNYCLTVTNLSTTCAKTDCATVSIEDNPSTFTLLPVYTTGDPYATMTANPVNTNTTGIPGFGYYWAVEEVTDLSGLVSVSGSLAPNPNCFWTPSTSFPGYDGSIHNSTCLPSIGRFTPGHYYKVTRGTWSTACPWKASSMVIAISSTGKIVIKDVEAPEYSEFANARTTINTTNINTSFTIYPNPSTGNFTLSFNQEVENGSVQVLDYTGKIILEKNSLESNMIFDISNIPSGLYFVKVVSANGISMEKLIKN